jgi:Rad3-related DNA helicase
MTLKYGLFPHENVRPIQDDLILSIKEAIESGSNLVTHAPTGLGKTAASLSPAIEYAIEHKKTIFFLTSRHTQHKIAIDTLKEIKRKHDVKFSVADIIGKKHMCVVPGIEMLYSGEFGEYCKSQREEGNCMFYSMTKNAGKLSGEGSKV